MEPAADPEEIESSASEGYDNSVHQLEGPGGGGEQSRTPSEPKGLDDTEMDQEEGV